MKRVPFAVLPLVFATAGAVHAQSAALDPVVVSATRTERAWLDVPASVDLVDGVTVRDAQLRVNLSESLGRVPGLVILNRQNYAQDLQLSVRGFGSRATFGVRGLRLYVDGVPASFPDGQGQVSHFPLNATESIEILRGPFSALYGNSSGGVISLTTALKPQPLRVEAVGRSRVERHLARGREPVGRYRSLCVRARCRPLLDRRISRPQRGHTRFAQPALRHRGHAHRTRAAGAQLRVHARFAGPARPDARADGSRSRAGVAAGAAVQHAQDDAPDHARRRGAHAADAGTGADLRRLGRHAQRRAVPGDSRGHAASRRPTRAASSTSIAASAAST